MHALMTWQTAGFEDITTAKMLNHKLWSKHVWKLKKLTPALFFTPKQSMNLSTNWQMLPSFRTQTQPKTLHALLIIIYFVLQLIQSLFTVSMAALIRPVSSNTIARANVGNVCSCKPLICWNSTLFYMLQLNVSLGSIFHFMLWHHCVYWVAEFRHKENNTL